MKSSKLKSLKDEVLKIKVFKNGRLQNWSLQQLKSSKLKVLKNWRLNNKKFEVFKNWSLEKLNSCRLKSSKFIVSKIEVFKNKASKNSNFQTRTNNFAFESNTEIRLESTLISWRDKAEHKARSVALKL